MLDRLAFAETRVTQTASALQSTENMHKNRCDLACVPHHLCQNKLMKLVATVWHQVL